MAAAPIYRLSGGASNTVQNASLGGIMSTSTVASTSLFDNVAGDESAAGDVEYRGVYVLNNGSVDLSGAKIWIQAQTPDAQTDVAIGLATEGANATMGTIANENTAPAGVTFSQPSDFASGISIGTLAAGQRYGIWVRRTVNAGAAAFNNDGFTLRVQGDSAA